MVSKMGDIAAELRLSVASNLSRWVRHVEDVDLVFAVCSCFQVRATVPPFFFRAPAMFRRHRCCGSPGRRFMRGAGRVFTALGLRLGRFERRMSDRCSGIRPRLAVILLGPLQVASLFL